MARQSKFYSFSQGESRRVTKETEPLESLTKKYGVSVLENYNGRTSCLSTRTKPPWKTR